MEKSLTLRQTLSTDIPMVREFESSKEASAYVYQWRAEQHLNALNNKDTYHFCIEHEGEYLGYGIINGLSNAHRTLELMRLVVLPAGNGWGRLAMERIKRLAFESLGARKLWLDVAETNQRAIRLYESIGFVREGALREHALFEGIPTTMYLYGLLEKEWAESIK